MIAADFKPVSDLFQTEEAVHKVSHFVLCKGTTEGITTDSMEIDKIIKAKYPGEYQQDLHELRTSLVTAWAMQLLIEDCFEMAEGNLLNPSHGMASKNYRAMQGHQTNRRRAQMVAECVRFLNMAQSK